MGIGIVLLFWLTTGIIAAGIGALILTIGVLFFTRRGQPGRKGAFAWSWALPFLGVLWFVGLFVFQATINAAVFQRDPGLGDYWVTPLPNGYYLSMIDVMDRGWVDRKTEGEMGRGVSHLQVEGRYVLAQYAEASATENYFLLDTTTDSRRAFLDLQGLEKAVRPLGISPVLEPVGEVYRRYRSGWFDYLMLLLFLAYPVGALVVWIRRVRQVRQAREEPVFEPS